MKHVLNYLCDTLDARQRRARVAALLQKWFPNRVILQQTRRWDAYADATETINFLVPFGKQQNHLVLGAHYDAVPNCPGANDNGAAVIQLMVAAKKLNESGQEPDVTFCFWDHEEHYGSPVMGSKLFTQLAAAPKKAVVFDVSGIGDTLYVSGQDDTGLLLDLPSRVTPPSDDLNLRRAGIPTTLVCALPEHEMCVSNPETWNTLHTRRDTPDRVDDKALFEGSKLALSLVKRFSNGKQQ